MKIEAPTTDERAAGIHAWLAIPKRSFAKALQLQLPDDLQRHILNAIKDSDADTTEVGVPLSKGETTILRFAGIPVA